MDLFNAISSLNKIGVIFFILTLGALIYEVLTFRKEKSAKKPVLKLPDFDPNKKVQDHSTPLVIEDNNPIPNQPIKKPNFIPIIITSIILIVLGIFILSGLFSTSRNQSSQVPTQVNQIEPTPMPLRSSGVAVFDTNWNELTLDQIQALASQTHIYIGIRNIIGSDVDKARIRVNEDLWSENHVTTQFNRDKHVYYIEYTIPDDTKSLKIEAQLHSFSGGWPPTQ